ncbi:DUF4342 domain-containing protein [Clostridium sp. YIM B02555]|jgi:hypothetical protein|uniref:DUF4342 domain-containing protein n=1 Tax=Clostridium sp. YIM B02555 TaxID=2911968 RepID=UPI001EEF6C43|nr:DUF4342 domain-containing protein [Clostridium sp. YIM B02555]
MEKITLEKVDVVRERTGVSYEKAKEALEKSEGEVLDAIIYIEKTEGLSGNEKSSDDVNKSAVSVEELKAWFKQTIDKGNVTRIKIKKDDNVLVDIPVNAGIAAGVVAIVIPPILAAGVIAAIATQITIEITREDGSVEVVNKYVSEVAVNVKNKASDFSDKIMNKVNEIKNDINKKDGNSKQKSENESEAVYSYTVNFDKEKENSEN